MTIVKHFLIRLLGINKKRNLIHFNRFEIDIFLIFFRYLSLSYSLNGYFLFVVKYKGKPPIGKTRFTFHLENNEARIFMKKEIQLHENFDNQMSLFKRSHYDELDRHKRRKDNYLSPKFFDRLENDSQTLPNHIGCIFESDECNESNINQMLEILMDLDALFRFNINFETHTTALDRITDTLSYLDSKYTQSLKQIIERTFLNQINKIKQLNALQQVNYMSLLSMFYVARKFNIEGDEYLALHDPLIPTYFEYLKENFSKQK